MRRKRGLGDVSAEQRDEQTYKGDVNSTEANPGAVGSATPRARRREQSRNVRLKSEIPTFVNNITQSNRSFDLNQNSRRLLSANKRRRYLLIVNTGAETVFVSFDSQSNVGSSIPIVVGGNYEPWVASNSELHARTAFGLTSSVVISEGYEVG